MSPIDTDVHDYVPQPVQTEEVRKLLLELEMAKLLDKLKLSGESAGASDTAKAAPAEKAKDLTEQPLTAEILKRWKAAPEQLPCCLFDGTRVCVSHPDAPEIVYTTTEESLWQELFQMQRLTFSAKPQYRWLLAHGVTPDSESPSAQDGEIAAYLLNSTTSAYEIERLCVTYHVPYHRSQGEFADLAALPGLCTAMQKLVEEQDMTRLLHFEQQLTVVLAAMEHDGIAIDQQGVRDFGVYLSEQLEEMQQMVYDEAGHTFNIGSPKQLGEVLFGEMQLPHGKKTKTGYSTNADILEKLRGEYAIVDYVLKWRQYSKLRSTYVDGLLKTVGEDGRIHTVYKQTETRTGRISSTEPNLQNIPVRTELGRNMRKFFVAREGCVLLDADYSQIELRLLANLSGDKQMQEAFLSGADIHAATAAQVFDMPREMVTPEMRSAAKAVNFGILYGMGAFPCPRISMLPCARRTSISRTTWHSSPASAHLWIRLWTRRRSTVMSPPISSGGGLCRDCLRPNKMVQAAGKRIAMNTPIQGTAADIIKLAMIYVYQRLKRDVPDAKLILQVHDELIVEVPEQHAVLAGKVLGEEMQNVIRNTPFAGGAGKVPGAADGRCKYGGELV